MKKFYIILLVFIFNSFYINFVKSLFNDDDFKLDCLGYGHISFYKDISYDSFDKLSYKSSLNNNDISYIDIIDTNFLYLSKMKNYKLENILLFISIYLILSKEFKLKELNNIFRILYKIRRYLL